MNHWQSAYILSPGSRPTLYAILTFAPSPTLYAVVHTFFQMILACFIQSSCTPLQIIWFYMCLRHMISDDFGWFLIVFEILQHFSSDRCLQINQKHFDFILHQDNMYCVDHIFSKNWEGVESNFSWIDTLNFLKLSEN